MACDNSANGALASPPQPTMKPFPLIFRFTPTRECRRLWRGRDHCGSAATLRASQPTREDFKRGRFSVEETPARKPFTMDNTNSPTATAVTGEIGVVTAEVGQLRECGSSHFTGVAEADCGR